MKLDKIKFASLIGFISCRYALTVTQDDMREMDEIIDIDVEPVPLPLNLSAVDGLMACMAEGKSKIEAIKYHRSLTGMGLKESKDAVEKYWRNKPVLNKSDELYVSKIIYFNEGDVKVEQHYASEWIANEVEDYDYDSPMGYGSTMLEAIADLNEKLKERE